MDATEHDDLSKAEISARRRVIFERTQARYAPAGIALTHPAYLALIARWIDGEITMSEAATEWDNIRRDRAGKDVKQGISHMDHLDPDVFPKMTQDQIMAEISKLID